MHLLDELRQGGGELSYFRAALLREDVARFDRLIELADTCPDLAAYLKAGLYAQWTKGDFRTSELKTEIEALLRALHAYLAGGRGDEHDRALHQAWVIFDKRRLELLIGC